MKLKEENNIIVFYWIFQSISFFTVSGFGVLPQFLAGVILLFSLLYLFTRAKVALMLCGVVYAIAAIVVIIALFIMMSFFGFQKFHLLIIIISVLNVTSIVKLIKSNLKVK